MRNSTRKTTTRTILALAILANAYFALTAIILPLSDKLVLAAGSSTWQRSALLSFGQGHQNYMQHVIDHTPEDATILIPRAQEDVIYGHQGLMQYFLFPRTITNCRSREEDRACLARFSGEDTYILRVGSFPDEGLLGAGWEYLPFSLERGLYRYVGE